MNPQTVPFNFNQLTPAQQLPVLQAQAAASAAQAVLVQAQIAAQIAYVQAQIPASAASTTPAS